jgi:hypothetical protein
MAVNTSISLIGLDFDTIKTNLKTHLKNNTAFRDYDYDGSNMATLIDLLSYNTYLNSFYTNMVASEMFMDTAQLRDSIVSHAKELNYLPRSYSSAKAVVNIAIKPTTSVSSVLILKGTSFTTKLKSKNYSFITDQNIIINIPDSNGVYSKDIDVYEGSYVSDTFVYNSANTNQRFVLSNPQVDTSSLTVTVIEDSGSTIQNYLRASSLFGVTSTSKVFFVQPAENGQYEIVFGDGIFGRKPLDGAAVVAEYRVSNGELPNGADKFINDSSIDGHANVTLTTITSAQGGSVAESTESIRFNAPRAVATQERAVTSNDYKTLLQIQFPEIQSVTVYGGEEAEPPQYGKVFISVDVLNADGIPESNKKRYLDFIKSKSSISILPEIIEPNFMYVDVNSVVRYNVNITQKQTEEISTIVQAAINQFSDLNLDDFEATLRYSQLVKTIDESDTSIVSNETSVRAIKILSTPELVFNKPVNYTIQFNIPVAQEFGDVGALYPRRYTHAVISSSFLYGGKTCRIEDDAGTLNIVTDSGSNVAVVKSTGQVNYETGQIDLVDFAPSDAFGGKIKFYIVPVSKDIFSKRNTILRILEEDINITVERIRE